MKTKLVRFVRHVRAPSTVQPPLTPTSPQRPLFLSPRTVYKIHSYFNLSTAPPLYNGNDHWSAPQLRPCPPPHPLKVWCGRRTERTDRCVNASVLNQYRSQKTKSFQLFLFFYSFNLLWTCQVNQWLRIYIQREISQVLTVKLSAIIDRFIQSSVHCKQGVTQVTDSRS